MSDRYIAPPGELLQTRALCKNYGGVVVTDRVDLSVVEGELHAIIGPNGAGKTTLISQLSGEILPNSGRILFGGRDITALSTWRRALTGLARTFQITSVFPDFTAMDNVALAVQAHAGHSFGFLADAGRDASLNGPAAEALEQVGLGSKRDALVSTLAHGEKRALELAMALATQPRVLLLDEPMAGMGPEDSLRMINQLLALKGRLAIVLVEHDMDAVFALADRITVLVRGHIIATGTPDEIRAHPEVRKAYLGTEEASAC